MLTDSDPCVSKLLSVVRRIGNNLTKKDISQISAYTIGRALTVLANWWFIIRTSVHSSIIPKDYSINNLVVNYADNEQIETHSLRTSKYLSYNALNKVLSDSDPNLLF